MELNLVLGPAGAGKTQRCMEEIQSRLKEAPDGRPLILLLPEHATFQMERKLAETKGLGGFTRVYVVGFRRLAHTVFGEVGGAVRPHITELGKRLVLSRLMQERQSELCAFRRAAGQRNFAEILSGMIKEFKTYAVKPDHVKKLQEVLPPSPLSDKLHDLAILYEDFEAFLAGRYTDPEDYLNMLAEKIPASSLLSGAEVWVDGFIWFNPRELLVLSEMLKKAANVTVTLCITAPDSPAHQRETALFHRQWKTREVLKEMARNHGAVFQETELTKNLRAKGLLAHIEKQFFSFPTLKFSGECEGLKIVEAANRRLEVEGIARDILGLLREKGYRWRDIVILIRDAETYRDLVETVLADYDIPFFSDSKRQSVHHPLSELLRSSLEIIEGGWSYDPIFRALKTGFFPLSCDAIDKLENYVLEFGIRGSRWLTPWTFVRRLSLDEDTELSDSQEIELTAMNELRAQVVAALAGFEKELKAAGTVKEKTIALYNFLTRLEAPEKLEALAVRAEENGDLEQGLEHRQLWTGLMELFEQMVETCDDQAISLSAYIAILNDGLENITISLIPPGLDYVTVAPLEGACIESIRAVYLPGVNDGVLPMRGRGDGLITDAERAQIFENGVELAPGAAADSFAERFLVYTALTRASEYLWVSYPLADEEGKGLSPSLVIKRLKDLSGASLASLPLEIPAGREQEYLVHPVRSLSHLAVGFRQYKQGAAISKAWWEVYNWSLDKPLLVPRLKRVLSGLFHHNYEDNLPSGLSLRLYPRRSKLRGSVTRFENFRACPFKHFAQYGLGLKERAVFRLAAPDFGQFLHAALKSFGERMNREGRDWGSVCEEEYRGLCQDIVLELAPKLQNEILLSSGQHKHLLRRLLKTVERSVSRLIEFDRASRFKPLFFEKTFGQGTDALPPLIYRLSDGTVLELTGQIDRLDYAEQDGKKYLLVLDYKSGGAWLRLSDVYYGLKLQLLTYLLAAQHSAPLLIGEGECLTAGILYYFLKNPTLSGTAWLSPEEIKEKINAMLKMPGWTLAEPEVIRLIDGACTTKSDFLKVALKKDDSFYSNCLAYVKTGEEFKLLIAYVEKMLVSTAEDIMQGNIGIQPYRLSKQTACAYCRYLPVCQFDRLLPENEYRKLAEESDDILMGLLRKELDLKK